MGHKIKHGEYKSIGSHWIALPVSGDNVTYFDSFGIKNIPKCHNKNITKNVYKVQANNLIICGYFCIGFFAFMFKGTSLLEYTNLFSPN